LSEPLQGAAQKRRIPRANVPRSNRLDMNLASKTVHKRRRSGRRARLAAGLAAVCAASNPAWAEPVARLEGLDGFELRAGVVAAVGEADTPPSSRWRARGRARDAAERALDFLRSEGYYAAVADPRLDEEGRPIVRVMPGERFLFDSITVELGGTPPQTPDPGAGAALHALDGRPVRAEAVLFAAGETQTALWESGFPDAELSSQTVTVDHADARATGVFVFDPGAFIRLGEPQFAGGAADLRPAFLARLAPYEIGDPASRSALTSYARRLQALESVSLVDVRIAPDAEGEVRPVDLRMEPTPRHRIELGASYSTTEGPGASGEWSRRNMFRGDETLTAAGQLAAIESRLGVALDIPHFRRHGQTLGFEAEAGRVRSDAFDQESVTLTAALTRRLSPTLVLSAAAEGGFSREEDAAADRSLIIGTLPVGLAYDDRNDLLDPTEGLYLEAEFQPGFSFGDEYTRFVRAVGSARLYQRISEEFVLAGRMRAGALFGVNAADSPANLRFFAGGGGSVRGFDFQALSPTAGEVGALGANGRSDELFGGRSLIEAGMEARWRRSERLGFVAFLDAGAAGPDLQPPVGDMRFGAGLGVRYYPGFGPLRLDLATPLDRRDGESPVQVYISIGQAF